MSALSSLDSVEAVPAIITAPLSASKFQFLAGIGTPAAVEHIIERLHSLNPQTRELAIEGLANGGGRWAAPILVTLLDDPNLTVPEKKNTNDPLGLNARVDPLNNWPESHRAHSALFTFYSRFGMNGQFRNLYLGESNDVRMEITQLKAWWKEHGEDFLAGRNVPNPNLTSVWYNDP